MCTKRLTAESCSRDVRSGSEADRRTTRTVMCAVGQKHNQRQCGPGIDDLAGGSRPVKFKPSGGAVGLLGTSKKPRTLSNLPHVGHRNRPTTSHVWINLNRFRLTAFAAVGSAAAALNLLGARKPDRPYCLQRPVPPIFARRGPLQSTAFRWAARSVVRSATRKQLAGTFAQIIFRPIHCPDLNCPGHNIG